MKTFGRGIPHCSYLKTSFEKKIEQVTEIVELLDAEQRENDSNKKELDRKTKEYVRVFYRELIIRET